jgi:hypothetical protein
MPAGEDDAVVEIVDRPHAVSHVLKSELGLRAGLPPFLRARFGSSNDIDPRVVREDPEQNVGQRKRRIRRFFAISWSGSAAGRR